MAFGGLAVLGRYPFSAVLETLSLIGAFLLNDMIFVFLPSTLGLLLKIGMHSREARLARGHTE